MAEGVQPPADPPRAATAPQTLHIFLYLLARDVLPPGYITSALSRAQSDVGRGRMSDEHLKAWAEDIARQLAT